jgi:aspartyl-tRNA(Asn)/glutamyl-tRNA(Gln) amidotransferase subunit B
MIKNKDVLEPIIRDIITNNPQTLADYKNGKTKAYQYFVGQVMKKTAGKADSKLTSEILDNMLRGSTPYP